MSNYFWVKFFSLYGTSNNHYGNVKWVIFCVINVFHIRRAATQKRKSSTRDDGQNEIPEKNQIGVYCTISERERKRKKLRKYEMELCTVWAHSRYFTSILKFRSCNPLYLLSQNLLASFSTLLLFVCCSHSSRDSIRQFRRLCVCFSRKTSRKKIISVVPC